MERVRTARDLRRLGKALGVLLIVSGGGVGCGGDDAGGDGGAAGAGSGGGAAGANAGRGGSNAGRGGQGGGGSGGMSGRSGTGGSGGAGSGGGGSGGSGGSSGSGGNAGADAGSAGSGGTDAGMDPTPTMCLAPVVAQNPGNACPNSDPVALTLTPLASGLDIPVLVTHAPDDDTRLFVVERNGRIVILDPENGDEVADFLDLGGAVVTSSNVNTEAGLLGLAFHPSYPDDPRFYVQYSTADGQESVISSFEVSDSDPNAADPDSEMDLLRFDDPAGNHNGGMLAFGPDGCLFAASGDGGGGDDQGSGHAPEGNGQNLDTPLGKLLRFDVDNPQQGAPGNLQGAGIPHIWDYGLRNPWRFSFDRMTGDLYIGDVGQGAWEEVDVETKGDGNKNYGWKIAEGNHCRPGQANCDMTDLDALVGAVDEYAHADGDDCVVGGYVYRGSGIPSLQGWYVYGDNGPGRKIRAFVWDGEGRCGDRTIVLSERDNINLSEDITSFGEDANGELYVTTSSNVYRIDAQ